ncbi:uncharacterized protein LOC6561250 isoform X1 [Drosophila grimshawi]|uniref:uncharacterized protein LOC6561250 isoform X1 n=1 Tax=Drosophila grimshawi TaxID=7222 RepID=UPI000C86F83E|nr:uncharacterized protein LOC6561250 isoform X1 [Drosophila grimshawi]
MAWFSVTVLLLLESVDCGKPKSRFNNLKCESYDLAFSKFKKCKLNVVGRGVVALNVYINLFKVPIYNVNINWSFWRRYNTFQPFLYNISSNFCELVAHPNMFTFEGLVLKAIMTRSNLNHTCPYDHDIIIDNLVFYDGFLNSLPLPQGEYKVKLLFAADKIWRLMVEVYILREE